MHSLKNWVDWISTRWEKNATTSKIYILRKRAQIWSTRRCRLGQEVACWFQCWKILACFAWLVTFVLFMWKWMGFFLRKNNLLRCWVNLYLFLWQYMIQRALYLFLPSTWSFCYWIFIVIIFVQVKQWKYFMNNSNTVLCNLSV